MKKVILIIFAVLVVAFCLWQNYKLDNEYKAYHIEHGTAINPNDLS